MPSTSGRCPPTTRRCDSISRRAGGASRGRQGPGAEPQMALPWGAPPVHADGPAGYTYGAVAVRCGDGRDGRDGLVARLRALRFTGWVGPVEDGWVLAVAARPGGTVAAGRRGLLDVGA